MNVHKFRRKHLRCTPYYYKYIAKNAYFTRRKYWQWQSVKKKIEYFIGRCDLTKASYTPSPPPSRSPPSFRFLRKPLLINFPTFRMFWRDFTGLHVIEHEFTYYSFFSRQLSRTEWKKNKVNKCFLTDKRSRINRSWTLKYGEWIDLFEWLSYYDDQQPMQCNASTLCRSVEQSHKRAWTASFQYKSILKKAKEKII